ncbi:ATP-dependent DNA helicase RecG [bacterium]|nr:ATP-dependent DNA helicase RecG [bacterium]
MITLTTSIKEINRVGVATANKLNRLGVETVEELLFYFPFRYEEYKPTLIKNLVPGQNANVVGKIELIQNKRSPRKRIYVTEALIADNTEQLKIVWFNQPYITRNLRVGDTVSVAGKIETDYTGNTMVSPAYEIVHGKKLVHTKGIVPIYNLTANLTSKQIRFLVEQTIELTKKINDWLPTEIIKKESLLSLGKTIELMHFPKIMDEVEQGRKRLAFNELFILQFKSHYIKEKQKKLKAMPIKFREKMTKNFVASLPFKLTDDQKKSAWRILKEIADENPMARLLDGDVGCGKTIVAMIAMLNVAANAKNSCQAALMAPTEILAQQHFNTFCKFLSNIKVNIALLTHNFQFLASYDDKEKKLIKKKCTKKQLNILIKNGEIQIVIGTQALIQNDIKFSNLVFAAIDEQHRFGVGQRKKLIDKSGNAKTSPHLLSMTATPIPRSLALVLYGDLKISIIKQMPKGRKPIITRVISEQTKAKTYNFIRSQVKNGRQVFVVCPLIDISDKLGVKSVKEEYKKLNEKIFKDLKISMLHGRMKGEEKNKIMEDFINKQTNILVSTSVIEVGVDIPNATIMIIEGAERFGLSQLHQFRGRIGRGEHQSYCFLIHNNGLNTSLSRLKSLEKYTDGFILANIDLKTRGPGETLGYAQKGFPELKFADIFNKKLLETAAKHVNKILTNDPALKNHDQLLSILKETEKSVHLE